MLVIKPFTFSNGTVADAIEVNAVVDVLYNLVNGNLDSANLANNAVGTNEIANAAVTFAKLNTDVTSRFVPVGTIIPFWDFDGDMTFSSTYWKYCNGQNYDFGGAIGVQALPDLSNRYIVGYGTEGGGDNGTAAWAPSAVGNANHQISLAHAHTVASHTHNVNIGSFSSSSDGSHTHTVASHTHSISSSGTTDSGGSHSHTVSSHTHTSGSLRFENMIIDTDGLGFRDLYMFDSGGTQTFINNSSGSAGTAMVTTGGTGSLAADGTFYTGAGSGATGSASPSTDSKGSHTHTFSSSGTSGSAAPATDSQGAHTHTIDPPDTASTAASPATDSQLSATQSIQPRSLPVRYLMRVL